MVENQFCTLGVGVRFFHGAQESVKAIIHLVTG